MIGDVESILTLKKPIIVIVVFSAGKLLFHLSSAVLI